MRNSAVAFSGGASLPLRSCSISSKQANLNISHDFQPFPIACQGRKLLALRQGQASAIAERKTTSFCLFHEGPRDFGERTIEVDNTIIGHRKRLARLLKRSTASNELCHDLGDV